MAHVPLEIPRLAIAVGRLAGRNDPTLSRAEMSDDSLDHSIVTCGVPSLEQHEQPEVIRDEVALELHQLDLELAQFDSVAGCRTSGSLCLPVLHAHAFGERSSQAGLAVADAKSATSNTPCGSQHPMCTVALESIVNGG